MPTITGRFSGAVTAQSAVAIPDHPLHALVIAAVCGQQTSDDANWDKAKLTYYGMGDLVNGAGLQSGYFHNDHINGDTTDGSFEARVSMNGYGSKVEGTWTLTSGTGKYSGITGGGTFQARSINPITVDMTWDGEYSLPGT